MTTYSAPERVFAVPNLLTLARLPLAGLIWLRPEDPAFAAAVLVAAALTDAVDGRFARAVRRRRARRRGDADPGDGASPLGAWLDPACDKIFVLSAIAAVAWISNPPPAAIPVIATREIGVIPLAVLYWTMWRDRLRFDFRAGPLGKLTTVCQFAAVGAMLARPEIVWPLAVLCGALGALAVADYAYRGWRLARADAAGGAVSR